MSFASLLGPGKPRAALAAAAVIVLNCLTFSADAQQPLRITPPGADPAGTRKEKATHEKELEKVRAEQRKAAEHEAKLKAEIAAIGLDRKKLSQNLIDTAARLHEVEARMTASEARLAGLRESEAAVRTQLEGKRAAMTHLLAALQRMGRSPPPAFLVRPEDALAAVRGAMLLGAVLPEMRAEAEALASDLASLVRIATDMATERAAIDRDMAALTAERQRMALLVDERQKRQVEAEKALDGERQRALMLARQVDNLKDLIAKLEQDAGPNRTGSIPPAGATPETPAAPRDARLGPAVAFATAKKSLALPISGVKLRDFGAADGFGGTQRGLSIAARMGAQVTAPSDGWVVYAGPFRSYGQLLILNVGGGYHILLAGMERISVNLGQFVLAGEPVATMGGGPKSAAAVALGSSQPVLYVEFRKDGTPVDPGPWWAFTEKVRG